MCCIGTLWWGTYDARTGVIFDGHMIEAEPDVIVDQNRMARIELTPSRHGAHLTSPLSR